MCVVAACAQVCAEWQRLLEGLSAARLDPDEAQQLPVHLQVGTGDLLQQRHLRLLLLLVLLLC